MYKFIKLFAGLDSPRWSEVGSRKSEVGSRKSEVGTEDKKNLTCINWQRWRIRIRQILGKKMLICIP